MEHSRVQGLYYLCDARRGCLNITTCIQLWLEKVNSDRRHEEVDVILYCDKCPGQNKNRCIFGMLFLCTETHPSIRKMQLKYFPPGHTQLNCCNLMKGTGYFLLS
jgi:hypothetical protein